MTDTVYKKVIDNKGVHYLVTMKKLRDTLTNEHRTNAVNVNFAKCRASKLKVIDIRRINPVTLVPYPDVIDECVRPVVYDSRDPLGNEPLTIYKKGQIVYPDNFDADEKLVCASGIHYFKNKLSALMYWNDEYKPQSDEVVTTWYESGQREYRGTYNNDKINGLYESWYENGQHASRGIFKDGEGCGSAESWYESGQMELRCTYNNDKRNGLYESWYESGQIQERCTYENDRKNGLYESWYEGGQMERRTVYKNDLCNGLFESWHANGQMKERCIYENNVKNGLSESCFVDGLPTKQCIYKDGVRVTDDQNKAKRRRT